MKYSSPLLIILLLASFSAQACGFRLTDGRLLSCGMNRLELIDRAGQPIAMDTEVIGVSASPRQQGRTVETWSYILPASIGGNFLVSVTLENGTVTAIDSRQQKR